MILTPPFDFIDTAVETNGLIRNLDFESDSLYSWHSWHFDCNQKSLASSPECDGMDPICVVMFFRDPDNHLIEYWLCLTASFFIILFHYS